MSPTAIPVHATSSSQPAASPPQTGDLTVRETVEGWSLDRWHEDGYWESIGVYADFDTADEIRAIAASDPDALSHDGRSPDRAVPFSAIGVTGGVDDIYDTHRYEGVLLASNARRAPRTGPRHPEV